MEKERSLADMLLLMWQQQIEFMELLQLKRNFPDFPVDVHSKQGQKFLKDLSHDCMHELFEAVQLLKNSKDHRVTNIDKFDKESFVEELVDSLHYFFEICISAGLTPEELYKAYIDKGNISVKRINEGY